ncbi:MAG TPA: tetratricopeptide repeat protein [Gemmataceae bacterium]|jgi:tetratricopeptide (TPR) repeat protein
MGRTRILIGWAAAALLAAAARGPAAGDDGLRQKALQLNDITGKDAITGKILELIKDKPELKKLIAEAGKMAKDKDQPFNYNGAYILAKAAYVSKDFDNSLAFYKICADQAVKLRSGQKLVDVYDGLIALFLDNKKYDEAVKACQEFLDVKGGGQAVERVKPFVMEKMIQSLAKQQKFDEALKLTEKLIEADEGGWYFMRLKAEVLFDAGKVKDGVDAYEAAVDKIKAGKDEDKKEEFTNLCRETVGRWMLDSARREKYDQPLAAAAELAKNDWYFAQLRAEVLREAGKLDESIAAFQDAITQLGKAKGLENEARDKHVERCKYAMSGVYTDMGQIDKATDQLRELLKAHPDSSTYNNDLGYVLADHDKDLDAAEAMIRKALELDKAERAKLKDKGLIGDDDDKENAAYLDSLGWVLYKKKNYAEAKKYLSEACKSDDGKHVEIYDHLAEVHKALGEKAEAAAVWQKALDLENVSKRDEARKEAIKKKMAEESGANP